MNEELFHVQCKTLLETWQNSMLEVLAGELMVILILNRISNKK